MASFGCDKVKQYVERLINRAITEARHVFCFTSIVYEFEEERAKLEAERITMRQHVKVAKQRDDGVAFWEEEVDKLSKLDTKTKETCFFGFCPDCVWLYKKGKELATSMEQIKLLKKTAEKFENIELHPRLPDIERYSFRNYISFKSRESTYKELLDALIDDNNYIIGLQGMGGTGKTTLAKEAGKELKQSKQFSLVIDTTVSFTPNIKKIQDDIAGPIGMKLENCSESERAIKLRRRLTNGDKILLIVDDVWDQNPLIFEAIGIPNRDDHKGCRVLVTTRCKGMLYKMNCDKRIELDLLTEEDAWIMFERYAGINNSSLKSVIGKGRKIAKECKQLPIAIVVIASSCNGHRNRIHEWDAILKSLKSSVSMHDVDDDMVQIYKVLKLNYDYIKDEKSKGLFLLCSLFRENEEISIEVLTRFIIGAGLFEDNYGNYNDTRNRVIVAKNKLLAHYLLLEVGEKHVKMHDLVRAMARWIANKEIQGVNLSKTNQKLFVERETNIKYLSCEGKDMDLFSCKFKGSNLETLILKVDRDEDGKCIEVPNSFFENIVKLRVFYFLGNGRRPLSLPHSIQSLTNIRSILIDRVDLGNISILENLQSLETLDLVQCTIEELPSEISKLGKFKLLKLEYCEIKMNNPFEVIEKCSSLEELYFIDSFNGFCREITLPELLRYHISKGVDVMNDSLSAKVFHANDDADCFSKATLNHIMQTAEVLRLNEIKGEWRNLMPEIVPIDQDMHDLVELRLSCISQLQCLIDTIGSQVPTVLSKLVVLKLNRMENMEELFKGTLSLDSLKNLEKLSIKDCENLQSLFKCKLTLCNLKTIKLQGCPMLVSLYELLTSRNLVVLETLKIAHCMSLKHIIADERIEEESREEIEDSVNNNSSLGSMFPKLKVLDIERCPLLESIFPFIVVQDLPVLQTIKIRRCDGLKYIFGPYQHAEFASLSQLELFQLPNFIGMFCKSNHPISFSEKGSSSTSKPQLPLDLDPMKCSIFSWDTTTTTIPFGYRHYLESNSFCLNIWERALCLEIPSMILCNIKKFELSCFSKIKSAFIPSIASRMLLETLTIRNCDELKNIIDFGDYGRNDWYNVFPKMKELYIEGFPNMEYIFGHSTDDHHNHVEIQLLLLELKCLSLCNLPSLVTMCPKHYRIIFPLLVKLELNKCSQDAIKLMRAHFKIHPVSESLDSTIIKEDGDGLTVVASPPIATTQDAHVIKNRQEISKTNSDGSFMKVSSNIKEQIPKDDDELLNDQSTTQLGEIDTAVKPSQDIKLTLEDITTLVPNAKTITPTTHSELNISSSEPLVTYEHKTSSKLEGSTSENTAVAVATMPIISETKNDEADTQLYAPKQKSINMSVEYGTTSSTRSKSVSSSSGSLATFRTSSLEDGDDKIAMTSFSSAATATNDQVSRNDDAFKIVSSNIDEQFIKDDDVIVFKSPVASQFPLVTSKGDPSQKVGDLSSSLLVKRELEKLVSKKHLDIENLSFLTDFLVKHPSVRLKDTSLRDRYKGSAYNLLVDLLKFLETHSVFDVLGSCKSEFVDLIQDARNFGFDKDWLDSVERRTLLPNLQVSQDALQKLLVSKQHVTKNVEVLRLKIEDLKHQLTSSEDDLKNIIKQEVNLSASIGY